MTDYPFKSYGATITVKNGLVVDVKAGEISFEDQQSLAGVNGLEAHQACGRNHFPERLEVK